ncbi:unnamed protein product [Nezara viridula]|uniref:Xaa-Pro dipeptidase n=1 Tax=Nezara viridula TaxID=85310 RepID=A0A9P0MVD4_NEZVI|nr:unnamed protein product [Nezara viridula]
MSLYRRDIKNKPRWKDVYERAPEVPYISKGPMTLKVSMNMFCENRRRLVQELRKATPHALVLVQAASPQTCLGRSSYVQDSIFFWTFGYNRSRAMGAIDLVSSKSYLIVSRESTDGSECCEKRFSRKKIKRQYFVDNVWYLDELDCMLDLMKNYNDCREILILNYQKQELPANIFNYEVDYLLLEPVIRELMAKKTKSELKILRYIAKYLESALMHIMQRFRPGMTDNQLEAWFSFFMTYKSDFDQLTFCIFSGGNHLDHHNCGRRLPVSKRQKVFKEGELCIIDVGASYFGLKLSLGIVLPVSERFNSLQKNAYETVLQMRISVCRVLQPGTPFQEVQKRAEKSLIYILIESKLLYGTVEGAYEHGMGKFLIPYNVVRSMDVLCEDQQKLELGKTYLVQPGCYFTKSWLDEAYKDEVFKLYLTPDLRDYEDIVVKVSDPIIITDEGFRYLSEMPRACCTINDMRLVDQVKRSDFTDTQVKENLTVKPSSFRL